MVEIPCGICTKLIPSSCHRYGGRCCNACASFFSRSIKDEKDFTCHGSNECLKIPCVLGKGCKRCRFDKCIEIGMSTNGMAQNEAAAPEQPMPEEPMVEDPMAEPVIETPTVFATVLNSILTTSMTSPNLLKAYLAEGNGNLFLHRSHEIGTAVSDKITFLTYLLNKFPITINEFPAFIQLSLCKLNLKHLSINEQLIIRAMQNAALLNIANFQVVGNRLIELSNVSQHFLNVFYIFC